MRRRTLLALAAFVAVATAITAAVAFDTGDSKSDRLVEAWRAADDDDATYTDAELAVLSVELAEDVCRMDPGAERLVWSAGADVAIGAAVADVACPEVADALRRSYDIPDPEDAETCTLARELLGLTVDPPLDVSEAQREQRVEELSERLEDVAPDGLRQSLEELQALGPDARETQAPVWGVLMSRVARLMGDLCPHP